MIQVVCAAVRREMAPAASKSFPANAPMPRALLDKKTQEAAYPFGLTDYQQTELAMLMGTKAMDFLFLQGCRDSTNVRTLPG